MSVTGTAVDTPQITTEDVRWFMRDFNGRVPNTGVTNILLDGVEFSNEDIARAIRFTVSRWNLITPISNASASSIPDWLLMVGVCEMLLLSEAMRQNRNALTYSDGNVAPIGIDDKMQAYMTLAQLMKAEFEEKTKAYKVTQNLELAWGSLGLGLPNLHEVRMNKTAYDQGTVEALGLLGLSKLARFSLEMRPEMRSRSQKGDYDIIRQPKSNANNPMVTPDSRVSQAFNTLHDNSLHDPYATVF